jgi:hypothetical protein
MKVASLHVLANGSAASGCSRLNLGTSGFGVAAEKGSSTSAAVTVPGGYTPSVRLQLPSAA